MSDEFFGRMNDPSAGAWITGPCGDTVEFYLVIEDEVIRRVCYHTDGCEFTRMCCTAVARYIVTRPVRDALSVSAATILDQVPDLPDEHRHCAILAVSTFYKAIGRFWLEQGGS